MVASSLSRTSADYVNLDGTHTSELAAGAVREPDPMSSSGWSPVDASLITGGGVVTPRRTDAGHDQVADVLWTASGVRWGSKPMIGVTVYAQMTASAGNGACATNITNCATTGHTTIPQIFVVGGNGLPSGGSTIHLRQTDPCNDASGFALADLVQGWVSDHQLRPLPIRAKRNDRHRDLETP